MGLLKRSPASVRPPRGRRGGGSGGLHGVDGSAGSRGLPGGDGGGAMGGLQRRGMGHAVEASGRSSQGRENEIRTGGAGSVGILASSGGGASRLQGDGNELGRPFSGFLVLCVDITEQQFAGYKEKIEALGGKSGTGFDYRTATHIAVEGDIQPGGRAIWEGDGKVVTTTRWINSCFQKGKLLPNPLKGSSESLLPACDITPLASEKSTGRSCTSEGKLSKPRHGSSLSSSARRKLKFSPTGLYHNLLCCEEDHRLWESLYDYALRFRSYENRTLPGLAESFKLCKVSTKFILGRCYNLMASLHKQNQSLRGLFSSRNFQIYADDEVILDIPEAQLVIYSDTEGDKDYTSFVKMVRKEVFHDQPVPMDLVEWLSIMSRGVAGCHQNVLSNFIYLMEPFQGFGAFVTMYLQFSSIQDTAGWADLFNALRDYDDWKHPKSRLMLKTLAYVDVNGYLVDYEDDIRGLLRLLWNCSKHKAKREVKSFIYMVLADYPKLLSDL